MLVHIMLYVNHTSIGGLVYVSTHIVLYVNHTSIGGLVLC